MSAGKQGFAALQKVGKSLMLPVSVLPVAGILLGVGAAKFSWLPAIVSQIMEQAGGAVFGNMGLLFAIGVALGFTKNDGVSALAAAVGYFIMIKTLGVLAPGTDVGILGGILAGSVAAWAFNKFFKLELPAYLGFFSGKRSVPIITGFSAIALGTVLSWVWPPIGDAIKAFSLWAAYQNPELAFAIYGVVERSLIPLGLHHIWNAPFFFEAGSCVNSAGEALNGVLTCYLSADEATRATGNGFGQLAGGYMFKMFGLPAAAIAMWHTAKPENRAKIGGIMISAAFTSFLTGITEPIEFAFLFVAPVLYVIHALLAGSAFFLMNALDVVHGTSFSHGFIDYVVLFSNSQKGFLIPVFGLMYAVIYYVVFRVTIQALNLKTPGREDEVVLAAEVREGGDDARVGGIVAAFGGGANIATLDNCITRLRIEVKDINKVDKEAIKSYGASAVLVMGQGVQAIFGMEAEILRTKMADFLEKKTS
ncbi:PTS glucose transporter subunit IIBC [Reinekea sp. G2M2-21]|uniref:PTS glucose transporter subunit IIBC n=1 Tax=Reinekea sp. G2M2-21 TaxID=2788942 RepID=UPI0018AB4B01|nr:PTS glucose transporter subunit IIBC [Reinekea sp. G2M2-21]